MNVNIYILLLSFIIPILGGILFYKIRKSKNKEKILDSTIESKSKLANVIQYVNNMPSLSKYFDKQRVYLSQTGANYMFNTEIEPALFLCVKIIFGLLFFAVGFFAFGITNTYIKLCISVCCFFIGFKIINIILNISNKSDNEDMLRDIKTLYDTLKIQTNAGVFITQILQESYLFVKNKRLKLALQEMNRTIIVRNDIEYGLEEFSVKFKNPYIDMLVMTIEQSLQTGQGGQMLADISSQMSDVEHAINITEKDKLENKILMLQLALYAGILVTTVYVLAMELSGIFSQL